MERKDVNASRTSAQPRKRPTAHKAGQLEQAGSASRHDAQPKSQTAHQPSPRRANKPNGIPNGQAKQRRTPVPRVQLSPDGKPAPDSRTAPHRQPASSSQPAPRRKPSRKSQAMARWRRWSVRGFVGIIVAGFVVGLLFFARPTTSTIENRQLTPFPTFTIEGFLDGSFTNDLSLWFADTYPLREPLVSFNQWFQSLYGIDTGEKMIGGNVQADELPVTTEETPSAPQEAMPREEVEVPTEEAMAADIQAQIMNGLYVSNGAAYNMYYFSQEAVQNYAAAINACAQALEGQAKVYSVLAPTNSAVLDDATRERLGGTDQEQAIDYFNSLYDPSVGTVDSWQAIRDHASEYVYFRTDHHWTELGAFYVYQKLCEQMGIEAVDLSSQESMTFEGYLGTFYGQLQDPAMAANPDSVEAHIPNGTNDMTYWDANGAEQQGKVVTDVTGWASNSLYGTFIAGDQPLEHIHNPAKDDGSSCLVIKDSFGCAFAPRLVDNFEDLYIIDFRHSSQNIPEFVRENGIQNVVFVNNIALAGTLTVSDKLASMM